ncbi:hypothetical protein LOK49_LG10G00044 [Camellia lanceoleosa]|uniref:Uncharacterized protein n=1 Tax=Camellia lanceoleosa TaxID=1840588 RepID=A0ACC0GAT1_9ERIC|nr:hypothetical protein LOK49_LG10G00044 [Camellia lanceoleosa]
MAHSSNLPCDGDGICMICKKKSAEDLRNSSSNSFSSVSNNPPVDSMPFMETKERSFYDTGGDHDQMLTPKGINKGFEEGESTETGWLDDCKARRKMLLEKRKLEPKSRSLLCWKASKVTLRKVIFDKFVIILQQIPESLMWRQEALLQNYTSLVNCLFSLRILFYKEEF